jgi:phosphoglycolate phosphatase-like HAD superfamily hydrolase
MSSWRIRPGIGRVYGVRRLALVRFTGGGQCFRARGLRAPYLRRSTMCLVGRASGGPDREILVLWDVDGTLLNAGGVGADLYSAVFLRLFGRALEAVAPMAGRTDRAIILETLTLAGVPEPRRHVDPFIAGLAAQAPSVRTAIAARGRALPGAAAALAALGPGRRVHQSVLTGNIRPLAEVKLAAVGLRDPLDLCIGAYGDDHEERAELVQVARRRAAAVHGRSGFDGQDTVVVGDTPLDIAAALAAGARAIGVATGGFSAAALRSAGADIVLPDLVNTPLVLEALLAGLRRRARARATRRRARLELSGPAALGQRPRHLRCRVAAVASHVVPVVAQRRAAAGRGVVVAAPVVAAAFLGMRPLTVQLDDQLVLLVAAVPEAAAAPGLGERHLLASFRQPVRALDIPVVTELEQRVRSPSRRGYELVKLPPPPELLASTQRLPQRPLRSQPPPERRSNPPASVIQAIGRTREINDRLLDEGMRRDSARKPRSRVDARRQVDCDPAWLSDPPANRDGYVIMVRRQFPGAGGRPGWGFWGWRERGRGWCDAAPFGARHGGTDEAR